MCDKKCNHPIMYRRQQMFADTEKTCKVLGFKEFWIKCFPTKIKGSILLYFYKINI